MTWHWFTQTIFEALLQSMLLLISVHLFVHGQRPGTATEHASLSATMTWHCH